MATKENGATDAAAAPQPPQAPSVRVLNQYIRDLSFENIAAQKGTAPNVQPEINVQVNLDANKGKENQYEVITKLTVTAKAGDQMVFLLEVDYAGSFAIENVAEEQIHPFLMIECPRLIFPFVRRIVRDITADGGFPPLNVDTIDFLALYRNELARRAAEQTKKN
jgi:preprotein translocase subunit SecB